MAAADGARRVRFRGAQCIEFDAAQPPVVRLCGVGRQLRALAPADAQLECVARGLPPAADTAALVAAYAREMWAALQTRGFIGSSVDALTTATAADAIALERQLQLAELLLAQAALAGEGDTADAASEGLASPETALPQLQLAKKAMVGRADEGYVFGRRFVSVETFINAFEFEELVEMAQQRGLAVPDLSDAARKKVTAVERELCARHGSSGIGKPLKQLTLRELTVEARARGLLAAHASRDRDGKRSKKGLIEKLRPVLRQEVLDEKIRDQRDDLLRALLLGVLEQEAARNQTHALLELVQRHLARLGAQSPAGDAANEPRNSRSDAMDVDESGADARDDDDDVSAQLQLCYRRLLERLESTPPLLPPATSATQVR
ncbi:hypothetical protein PybrP1_005150 [[Pythium] brassicae (nom. inval.)]|nr:hypothetical protein PybrP1_005150 [[Pythium] brassicae (nom. inval.)]